jgi:hypothetical protein
MAPRFLLHIGANKTGTSSIQRMLATNAPALACAGWVYPHFHLSHCAHHPLAYALAGHPTRGVPDGWRTAFAQATADPGMAYVISSELFVRNVPPEAAATLFPPDQTRIVLYLREHLSYLASWYAQAVQERNLTASFDDYIRLFPQPFEGFLKRWEAVYGAAAITLRPFRRDAFPGGDIRQDMLAQMGGPICNGAVTYCCPACPARPGHRRLPTPQPLLLCRPGPMRPKSHPWASDCPTPCNTAPPRCCSHSHFRLR